jgi:uncharacterized protein (UPF0297 family)
MTLMMLVKVYNAFIDKGNLKPINQIAEYLISEEPLYITKNNDARNLIQNYDRYEILNHILTYYYNNKI